MAFIRKIKKGNAVYLAEVKNYREEGKVKQKVIRYIGKEEDGQVIRRIRTDDIEIESVKQYLNYKVLHDIALRLNLPDILGDRYKHILLLIYTQIVNRKSLYKIPEYIELTCLKELLNIDKIIDKHLYSALDELEELDFSEIEDKIFKKLSLERKEKIALVLDVTDTYFSGSQADWKSRKGKDGKYGKLIQIALAVTKEEGFPIMHRTYEGNISNIKIFQDLLTESRLKGFEIIIIDRGMISYENLSDLRALNQKVITGIRLNKKLKIKYLSTIDREEIFQPENQIKLKNTRVYIIGFDFEDGRLIAVYNPEIEVAKRMEAMEIGDSYKPEEARYMGYSLIYHTTDLSEEEVVRSYYEKDIVEKAFKELKSSINLHPIRKYLLTHVKAHIKICYLAYAILSYMQYRLKKRNISAIYVLEKLQPVYKVDLKSTKERFNWSKIVTLTKEQKIILDLLGCSV
ncbi:MAG TPA: transposase [Syntrophorhabdaceae bacterium]|nr:transposase [Syntrophorhabdaceae bacterium]HPP41691.1 transposase [Syntrophorhabdaceae bacterium]